MTATQPKTPAELLSSDLDKRLLLFFRKQCEGGELAFHRFTVDAIAKGNNMGEIYLSMFGPNVGRDLGAIYRHLTIPQ